ncbi:MAG: transposase [Actinobacteria bacterium]|nr:transposase [Actinomycetota bacterium]
MIGRSGSCTVEVVADGKGLTSRAGTAMLALLADQIGLTDALEDGLVHTRERRCAHPPGRVFCDLAVMVADGGRCVSDLGALGDQVAMFGEIASGSTARRVLLEVGERERDAIRVARARARERAWAAGAAPERVILDFDATLITAHSDKQQAAGNYKGGFGFHPLLVTCGRETLGAVLRPGNAGANTASDHIDVLELALEALPQSALDGEILARAAAPGSKRSGCARSARAQATPGWARSRRRAAWIARCS